MKTLIKLVLIAVVAVAAGFALRDFRREPPWRDSPRPTSETIGTSGGVAVDKAMAREIGAEIGEKTAVATERLKESAHDASITAKIKAKMTLDELVRARSIDVSTNGSTVTLNGSVLSAAEHDRAVALARETAGVDNVLDNLVTK